MVPHIYKRLRRKQQVEKTEDDLVENESVSVRRTYLPGLVILALGGALLMPCAAFALSQRGHVFRFSYGEKGKGDGELSGPAGVAVDDSTGDVYVADSKNRRVVQLEPVLNEKAELIGEKYAGAFDVPSPSSVAVDNATEESDPSKGDVYVVGGAGDAIYKFTAAGVEIGAPLKKFVLKGTGTKEKLESVEGIAVDAAGSLFAYQEDGRIYELGDSAPTEGVLTETGLTGEPGFALDSEDNYFVGTLEAGASAEGGFPTVAKLEGLTGKIMIPQLDDEDTTAVAVNAANVPANDVSEQNDVYLDNVSTAPGQKLTTVAQFAPEANGEAGELIQRFGAPGLLEGDGIAVDDETGTVYVTDHAQDDLDVFELEGPGPPRIDSLSTQSVPATPPVSSATRLRAQINPAGADTRYHFEYGTVSCAAAPSSCSSSAAASLGEGFGDREASVELHGLAPGAYHYRVAAENAFAEGSSGTVYSSEHTFTIVGVASGLPDGRAWEMVSPPDKYGAAIEALTSEGGLILASENGNALTYVANGAISEAAQANRSPEMQQVLASRSPQGWSSQDVATPQIKAYGVATRAPEYRFFSPDLSLALVEPFGAEPPLAPSVARGPYLRDDQPIKPEAAERGSYEEAEANSGYLAPGYLPLVSEASAPEASFPVSTSFLGATPDLSSIVLNSAAALTGPSSGAGLYEWSHGRLRFVSELPAAEGRPATPAPQAALGFDHLQAHAISSDGTRVIWTDSQESPDHIYVRDFAQTPAQTIQLDRAQGVSEPDEGSAVFQTASSDGSRVLFTDSQVLTRGSSAEPKTDADLYAYECATGEQPGAPGCTLTDLTIPMGAGEHAAVQGFLLGASEDGSSVYLVAHGVLADNENDNGERAEAGKDNLYELHHDGREWTRTFVAVLAGADSPDWDEGETVTATADTAFLTARVSPDGEYLAFMSKRSLTGYDNEDVSSVHSGERLDEEVYLYDSATRSLTCVSCDPTGARPAGVLDENGAGEGAGLVVDRREIWKGRWLAGNIPGWTAQSLTSALFQSRSLSDEGRLFFDSADALVPGLPSPTRQEEVDGAMQSVGVENVYEYEPAGVGSCETASGGCVALISSGTSQEESAFLEATPGGGDVFFLTAARLLPQDTDEAFDVYDARVCTQASPCLPPPEGSSSPCATAQACHPGSPPAPAPAGPSGSATFSGPGDVAGSGGAQEVQGVKAGAKPTRAKSPTRAQRLARALEACRKQHPRSRSRRLKCEAQARRLYGPQQKANRGTHVKRPSSGTSNGVGR